MWTSPCCAFRKVFDISALSVEPSHPAMLYAAAACSAATNTFAAGYGAGWKMATAAGGARALG